MAIQIIDEEIDSGKELISLGKHSREYVVTNAGKVVAYIEENIGAQYEVQKDTSFVHSAGSITVFGVDSKKHAQIANFITGNNLWEKDEV